MSNQKILSELASYQKCCEEAEVCKKTHLRDMMNDADRNSSLFIETDGVVLDCTRQKVSLSGWKALLNLAKEAHVAERIAAMARGDPINVTENRSVGHMALRAPAGDKVFCPGGDPSVNEEVLKVKKSIYNFATKVRNGEFKGHSGKALQNVICIGIGGSYLGPEFVYEALRTDADGSKACEGRVLRFLANVDPIDVKRATDGLSPESTLVVVISKTFTTAETMLNARTLRQWIVEAYKGDASSVSKHMIAVSSNIEATKSFGVSEEAVFGFWDWVGGRYSVCSAVGLVPLALHFGSDIVEKFLEGARKMDEHFQKAPMDKNIPFMLGALSVWNATFMGYATHAILPYCQALLRFPAHVQQVSMESNGKRVGLSGKEVDFDTGEIEFGEPGTNGQHSFYQLIHQGRVIPSDFIGFLKSQQPIHADKESGGVSNHDELMSNFFAQPDALAFGKDASQLAKEGVPQGLISHKTFPGDRPSLSLLMPQATPFYVGYLLAMYEHRAAVEGFLWGINSFDQWGVELGKVLAKNVRICFSAARQNGKADKELQQFPEATQKLLQYYLSS